MFPGEEEHDCRRRPSSGLKRIIDDTSSSSSKKKEEKAPVLNAGAREGGREGARGTRITCKMMRAPRRKARSL